VVHKRGAYVSSNLYQSFFQTQLLYHQHTVNFQQTFGTCPKPLRRVTNNRNDASAHGVTTLLPCACCISQLHDRQSDVKRCLRLHSFCVDTLLAQVFFAKTLGEKRSHFSARPSQKLAFPGGLVTSWDLGFLETRGQSHQRKSPDLQPPTNGNVKIKVKTI
jgi:hypothetical protein